MGTNSPPGLVPALDEVRERVSALEAQVAEMVAATEGANSDDEHDPEGSTIAFERAQLLALLDQAHVRARELSEAQHRVEQGSYGVCEACGDDIGAARLAARPAARTCIHCAQQMA